MIKAIVFAAVLLLSLTAFSQQPYIIPVVVHVVHYDGAENITDAQVRNGIRVLTRNYRKQNADTVDIIPAFTSIAADMEIEFRLAKLDPNGNCTNGINRVRSLYTNTGGHEVKSLVHWPRDKYLNIYVVKNAAGLAGHALMPFQADTIPGWDGIVIGGDYFGDTLTSNYVQSVVLSHEVGHFFDLFHIWGGNNVPGFYYLPVGQAGNCNVGDSVADTPPTTGWSSCNLNGASCGNVVDNVQNFMDYAYCARMFTEGQKQRVHAALNSPMAQRNNLWSNTNLTNTGVLLGATVCKADFSVPRNVYCTGENISFTDMTVHGANSWQWDFGDGNTSTLQYPQHSYAQPGIYTVTLTAGDGVNTATITKADFLKIIPANAQQGPLVEDFENDTALSPTGFFSVSESGASWELYQGSGFSGNQCVRVENPDTTQLLRYMLVSEKTDITGLTQPSVYFKYAYAMRDTNNHDDKLVIKISKNCGGIWLQRLMLTDTALTSIADPSGNFMPSSGNQWKQGVITNIPGTYINDEFMVRFEFLSKGGNPVYIDDINIIDYNSLYTENTEDEATILVYPNPAQDQLTIQCPEKELDWKIVDITGKLLMQGISSGTPVNISTLAPGIYFIHAGNKSLKWIKI